MKKEDACFIHDNEIYYQIDASDKEIDQDLERMVDEAMHTDEFDYPADLALQAQKYLIIRQTGKIMKNYCE